MNLLGSSHKNHTNESHLVTVIASAKCQVKVLESLQ